MKKRRMLKALRILILSLLVVMGALYLLISIYFEALLARTLPGWGVEISELSGAYIAGRTVVINDATFEVQKSTSVSVKGVRGILSAGSLLNGRIEQVQIDEVRIAPPPIVFAKNGEGAAPQSIIIPIHEAKINRLALELSLHVRENVLPVVVEGPLELSQGNLEFKGVVNSIGLREPLEMSLNLGNLSGSIHTKIQKASLEKIPEVLTALKRFIPSAQSISGTVSGEIDVVLESGRPTAGTRGLFRISDLSTVGEGMRLDGGQAEANLLFDDGFVVKPLKASASTLNIGVPLSNVAIEGEYSKGKFAWSRMGARVFGGEMFIEPGHLRQDEKYHSVILAAKGLEISEIFTLYPNSHVTGSGRFQGKIPITAKGLSFTVESGVLESEGGGKLSVPESEAAQSGQLAYVMQALRDFTYSTFNGGVSLDPKGNLKLSFTIDGRSAVFEGNQPVKLNISIEENLFELIRSLRTASDLTKRIEASFEKKEAARK